MTYAEKLKDPRWQRKRLEILQRDDWACVRCGDKTKTLHVHHKRYKNNCEPWEYGEHDLEVLCEICHGDHHVALKELPICITQIICGELPGPNELSHLLACVVTARPSTKTIDKWIAEAMEFSPEASEPLRPPNYREVDTLIEQLTKLDVQLWSNGKSLFYRPRRSLPVAVVNELHTYEADIVDAVPFVPDSMIDASWSSVQHLSTNSFLDLVKQSKPSLLAHLDQANLSWRNSILHIACPAGDTLLTDALQRNRQVLDDAVQSVRSSDAKWLAFEDPTLRNVLDIFGGTILGVTRG